MWIESLHGRMLGGRADRFMIPSDKFYCFPEKMSFLFSTQVPKGHEWESLTQQKYYKSLCGEFNDGYLGH